MKKLYVSMMVAGLGLFAAAPSQAASNLLPQLPEGSIEQVAGGCGPGRFRDAYGYCRMYRGPVARPAYRACPPGMHLNRWGRCRPNF